MLYCFHAGQVSKKRIAKEEKEKKKRLNNYLSTLFHSRTALVESTGKVSKKWGYLYDFYSKLRERKGNKIARVALARKILMLSWHLVVNNQTFNPNPKGRMDSVKTGSS